MKINWHAIGGIVVGAFGWILNSGVINLSALPHSWAPFIGLAGLLYASQSGKAVTASTPTPGE